jgi:hypothetical protein
MVLLPANVAFLARFLAPEPTWLRLTGKGSGAYRHASFPKAAKDPREERWNGCVLGALSDRPFVRAHGLPIRARSCSKPNV